MDEAATKVARAEARAARTTKHARRSLAKADEKVEEKTERAADKSRAMARAATGREDNNAAGAIAQCKDGTYWHAKTTRGACSRHGGIAKKL